VLKRAFDVTLAAVGLVALSPVLALAAVLIELDSPGPVLFRQVRVGRDGRPFRILKLRTMVVGAERLGPNVSPDGDPRVTRVGRLLRRTHVDELPQLLNVLRGDMSLVGPRPETPEFVALYSPAERRVLSVRPGIAGPSTLAYRREAAVLAGAADPARLYVDTILHDRVRLDLTYLGRRSLAYDVGVVLRTVLAPLLPGGREALSSPPEPPAPEAPPAAPGRVARRAAARTEAPRGGRRPPRRAGPAAGTRPSRS
jgi:lipopolysaccharide/colanic/teichoic acid biosynthesis glycosyltransferase